MAVDWIVGYIQPNAFHEQAACRYRTRRLRDNGELRYCLRSIFTFAPWIRRVYGNLGGDSKRPASRNDLVDLIDLATDLSGGRRYHFSKFCQGCESEGRLDGPSTLADPQGGNTKRPMLFLTLTLTYKEVYEMTRGREAPRLNA